MGVRLYVSAKYVGEPLGKDIPTPEELIAGVIAGTAAKLDEYTKTQPKDYRAPGYHVDMDAWYAGRTGYMEKLDTYRVWGHGKLNLFDGDYIKSLGMDPNCGSVTDPAQIKRLLETHRVNIPVCLEVTEVSWN